MSWAHPWALWTLPFLPVLALLFLRRRPPRSIVVGTFEVWRRVDEGTARPRAAWHRVLVEVLPPLAAAALLVIAAAGPGLAARRGAPLAILLDRSPSLGADLQAGGNRLAAAVARARDLVAAAPPDAPVLLAIPPAPPRPLEPREALALLAAGVELAAASQDLQGGLAFLAERAAAGECAWYLGDVAALTDAAVGVELFGEAGPNAGVVRLGVERTGGRWWLGAEVASHGGEPAISVTTAEGVLSAAAVEDRGHWRVLVDLGERAPSEVVVGVELEGDRLAADDRATWRPPSTFSVQASDAPAPLLAALLAIGWEQVEDARGADVLVTRHEPPPSRRAIVLHSTDGGRLVTGDLAAGEGAPPELRAALGRVSPRPIAAAAAPGGEALLSMGGAPLIVGAGVVVHVLHRPEDLPVLTGDEGGAYPLLWRWIAGMAGAGVTGLLDPAATTRAAGGERTTAPPVTGERVGRRDLGWVALLAAILVLLSPQARGWKRWWMPFSRARSTWA